LGTTLGDFKKKLCEFLNSRQGSARPTALPLSMHLKAEDIGISYDGALLEGDDRALRDCGVTEDTLHSLCVVVRGCAARTAVGGGGNQ
jgi:hypothetical protein